MMCCCQHLHHGDESTVVSETEKADCKYWQGQCDVLKKLNLKGGVVPLVDFRGAAAPSAPPVPTPLVVWTIGCTFIVSCVLLQFLSTQFIQMLLEPAIYYR